jgi:hypothetical protein
MGINVFYPQLRLDDVFYRSIIYNRRTEEVEGQLNSLISESWNLVPFISGPSDYFHNSLSSPEHLFRSFKQSTYVQCRSKFHQPLKEPLRKIAVVFSSCAEMDFEIFLFFYLFNPILLSNFFYLVSRPPLL